MSYKIIQRHHTTIHITPAEGSEDILAQDICEALGRAPNGGKLLHIQHGAEPYLEFTFSTAS